MNFKSGFKIVGVGKHLPPKELYNNQIEENFNLPSNWINKNIGVEKRHKIEGETNSEIGAKALKKALLNSKIEIEDIDYLIAASATFDYVLPNRSSCIKSEFIEANKLDFPCIDINSTCLSFVSALHYASLLLTDNSSIKNIAIVSSEIASNGLNQNDVKTYSLFGDAATAIIISKDEKSESGLINYNLKTYSEGNKYTIIEAGGNFKHPKKYTYNTEDYSFKMQGKKLLKLAMQKLPDFVNSFFSNSPFILKDVDIIIPHQASKMGLKILTHLTKNFEGKIIDELSEYGNCIAASIPLALVNTIESKQIKKGDLCFLVGTAAGISIGGLLFRY